MEWGSIISGGIQAVGGFLGQESANDANAKEARKNRDWQQRMSNSAHQREAADLEAAGLNRMLTMGGGASTPSGNVAQMQSTTEGLVTAAKETALLELQKKRQAEEIELMRAQRNKTNVEAEVAKRGIPEAELTNRIYKFFNEKWDKVNESFGTSGKGTASPKMKESLRNSIPELRGKP